MRNVQGCKKNTQSPLRIIMLGFFVAFLGWLIGMIDRGNSGSAYVQLGAWIAYVGVAGFLVGFFWLLVVFIEQQGNGEDK